MTGKRLLACLMITTLLPSLLVQPAYADNCTSIRTLYDAQELEVDSKEIEEKYSEVLVTYEELREEFVTVDAKKKTNALALKRLSDDYGNLLTEITLYSTSLDEIYAELTNAVNKGAALEVIYKLEQQYIQVKAELTSRIELQTSLQNLLLDINGLDSKLPIITDEEVLENYRVLQQLKAEYDVAKGYEDIGDVRNVKVPTSRGEYVINSSYGTRINPVTGAGYQTHSGLDLKASLGDQNLALFAGTVVVSEWSNLYGNYVIIDHGYGVRSLYGHAIKNLVAVGDRVEQYQPIQDTGSTGFSTGPHLHLGLLIDGKYVDPTILFNQ